jgi:hypothetical protein
VAEQQFEKLDRAVESQPADVLCTMLWRELKQATKEDWRRYQFLEQYLPESCTPSPT